MEQDGRETDAAPLGAPGPSRGQNVVYVTPHDWASVAAVVTPSLDRLDAGVPDLQLVIITPDPDVTAAAGAGIARLAGDRSLALVAATSSRRAGRLWRASPAQILAGDPQTLVDLVRAAALKLETVRAIAVLWVDELLTSGGGPHLETLMAELPKDAPRTIVCAETSPGVEEVIERYARRARRVAAAPAPIDRATPIEYVTVSSASRLGALRRLLDDLDPRSALVFARNPESETEVRELLRALGYGLQDSPIHCGLAASPETEVAILYDLPASREELREAVGPSGKRVVALVQPRQITSLRVLAAGGDLSPFTLPGAAERARGRDAGTRAELRAVLAAAEFGRELLTLEPLLDEYDGIEVAAAALQLLERDRAATVAARAAAKRPEARAAAAGGAAGGGPMVRLFVSVGSRDNVRPGDLVGAITNAAGVAGTDVGKVDVRESHSLVEVAAGVADAVVEKLTGTSIRGRRAIARIDTERPRRPASGRPPRDRGGDRFPKGDDRAPRGAHRRRDRE